MVELYLYIPARRHGMVLNELSGWTNLSRSLRFYFAAFRSTEIITGKDNTSVSEGLKLPNKILMK
jgi:hypothetical protein